MKKILCLLLGGLLLNSPVFAAEVPFEDWLQTFRAEAVGKGLSEKTLSALDGLELNEQVVRLDQSQPEHKITFAIYRKNILSKERIKRGRALYAEHRAILRPIAKRTGVPAAQIIALWGIESSYGALTGKLPVLQSLLTLAYEGRRADLFRGELLAALQIIERGEAAPEQLRGSWAGAMGQCQFMPSTYLNHAVDGDGDGVRDIWGSSPDVFASIANYLKSEGWKAGLRWGMAVKIKRPIAESLVGLEQSRSFAAWQKLGVSLPRGSKPAAAKVRYYLVQPDGAAGASYLVTENYKAVMRWNRSTYFATSVGLLADAMAP